jgi:hypothetical protein
MIVAFPVLATEPTPAKSACPSIDGDWSGDFDGSFEGTWSATFTQAGTMLSAEANIRLDDARDVEADGGGGVKCEGGRTAIAGSGSAQGKSGSFAGISDSTGTKLSGTWWSGDFAGSWRGERVGR